MRYYTVFNIAQIDDITAHDQGESFAPIVAYEDVIANMPQTPAIEHGRAQASYNPAKDIVSMPPRETFATEAGYYSTLFHKLTHNAGFRIMPISA